MLHTISTQIILICTFLAGFSATILSSFVTKKNTDMISNVIILSLLVSTCAMIISLFLLTNVFILTTEGIKSGLSPAELSDQFNTSVKVVFVGLGAFLTFISLSGWLNSRWMGVITTIIGILTFVTIWLVLRNN